MNSCAVPVCSSECLCASGYFSKDALQQGAAYQKVAGCVTVYFNFEDFRPGQFETVLAVLHGRDVFVRFPTGGGKSLHFPGPTSPWQR